jgi:hypothetical protein
MRYRWPANVSHSGTNRIYLTCFRWKLNLLAPETRVWRLVVSGERQCPTRVRVLRLRYDNLWLPEDGASGTNRQ